jgi:hypothetical protein
MIRAHEVVAQRVSDERGRAQVIAILGETYQREKHWISEAGSQFPPDDVGRGDTTWFVAEAGGCPAGVVRVLYDPPLAIYASYGFQRIDPAIRVEDFIGLKGLAEVGRFAVLPDRRRQIMVAATLMRAVTVDSIERGITHLITDVFEDDAHSPYGFHTRVLGFHPVATHDVGELNSRSRRITLLLDIPAAYKRLQRRNHWFYRYLASVLPDSLQQRLAA